MRRLFALLTSFVFYSFDLIAVEPFRFEDVTEQTGLAKLLEKHPQHKPWRFAHGAGWGDVNGDGRPDLYIGAFAARAWFQGDQAPVPNMLFLAGDKGFTRPARRTKHYNSSAAMPVARACCSPTWMATPISICSWPTT